jgi:hypothetical protein
MRIATLSEPVAPPTLHNKSGVTWSRHKYKRLRWGMIPAQLVIQGASPQALLGDKFILLRGAHRPPYHPLPGMDDVTIVQVSENPDRLGVEDIFLIVAG